MVNLQESYTAYTLTPISVNTREDAALYFCACGGCPQRFQTPCELQRHRLGSDCGAVSTLYAVSVDSENDPRTFSTKSGFVAGTKCQQCCDYMASCSYRLLVEHVRADHCGTDSHKSARSQTGPESSTSELASVVHNCPGPHTWNSSTTTSQSNQLLSSLQSVHTGGLSSEPSAVVATLNSNVQRAQSPEPGVLPILPGLDWEKYKHILHWLYVEQDNSLEQVMEYMTKSYGFNAKKRTFKEKLKLWGFEKNIPARDMRVIVAMVDERKRKQGKETRVYFKDRLVDAKKMDRFKKRKLHHEPEEEVYLHTIMRHVRCETPPVMEPTNARRSPEEPSRSGYNFDNPPQYIDLQTLEDVILAEYEGKKAGLSPIHPQLRCRSTCSLEVVNLFDKAFMFEDQGDLENGENVYLELLGRPQTELDIGAVFDALRGILRIRAIGCEYAPALLELERLVAGCLCLCGPDSTIYRELSVELAISYYKLERFEEGNALVRRILSIYRDYTGRLNEFSCERLLFWTSSRLIGLSHVPNFKLLCTRLLNQYQDGGKVDSALTLATDITDGLQFSNSFDEAEGYLNWVVSLYETHGNFELAHVQICLTHIETISCVLLNQLTNYPQSTVIKERFVDKLQRDILRYFTPPKPKPPPVIPLTRLALCYTALGLHSKAHALYEIIDLEDKALRASCSRENWKLLIQGLGDEACNLASLSELEDAERFFILAEEIAQRELGATHWRTKRAVAELNAFHHRDPDLWEGRFIVRLRSVGLLRDALTSPMEEVVLI